MGDLKPIGSEKLQGDEKLRRIMEIARYNDTERSDMNVNETVDYTRQLADGKYYSIIHEKNGYIIKSGLNESEMTYDEPAENRRYHSSYSKALKKLNLIIKEMNILHENDEGLNLFGEQEKKFVLKTPKPEVEEPVMEPEMDLDLDMGSEGGEEEMDLDMDLDMDLGTDDEGGEEELDMDLDLDAESPADEEEISIKEIQKLTGKLGQKLRTIDQQDGLSSEDIKYVLNSIISAVDLEKLTEEDKEDILENFEDDEIDYGVDDEADLDVDAGDELDLDMDLDMDMEEPMEESAEVGEKVMDEIFAESKIDKVLSKYFVISDEEKTLTESKNIKNFITEKIQKVTVRKEMKSMCETVEQELTANFLLKENKTIKFLGKTNKGNLVFENDGQQIKVSQKGELL
jgi:hypothetical protein